MVGIGILKKSMDNVVELFDWSTLELNELRHLVARGQQQSDMKKSTDIYAICLKWHMHWK